MSKLSDICPGKGSDGIFTNLEVSFLSILSSQLRSIKGSCRPARTPHKLKKRGGLLKLMRVGTLSTSSGVYVKSFLSPVTLNKSFAAQSSEWLRPVFGPTVKSPLETINPATPFKVSYHQYPRPFREYHLPWRIVLCHLSLRSGAIISPLSTVLKHSWLSLHLATLNHRWSIWFTPL